jgi:hypothetical protein
MADGTETEERRISDMNRPQWHDNWPVDTLLRVGFIALLAWVAINLAVLLMPAEGVVLTITTRPIPAPCPE